MTAETLRGWAVDPAAGREGPAELVVEGGVLARVAWLDDRGAADPGGLVLLPGATDLHAHLREPGDEDAETIASGLAAAARGGVTTVCAMPDTTPAVDDPALLARVRAAAAASGSPVRLLPLGAVTEGRRGETLAPLGELADAGVAAFTDDPAPVRTAALLRNALAYAGALGRAVVEVADDPVLTAGAEAGEGYVATVLGLAGAPAGAEAAGAARAIAALADVVRDEPRARLHLAHLSTAAALAQVRAAKAAGLPVTCDVAIHHLVLADEWLAGARRWAWEALEGDGTARDPWAGGALAAPPYGTGLRVVPPLRPAPDAAALLAGLADGTVDAVVSDHGPRTEVATRVEFGDAAPGIAGLDLLLPLLLTAAGAGRLPLARVAEALATGPARVLGPAAGLAPGFRQGAPADLVAVDRAAAWTVTRADLATRGRNVPYLGRELRGGVRLVLAGGREAHRA